MQLIRGSEIQDFLRCRKRWDYRWNQRLKPKRPDGKLFFGTLGHKFVESHYSNLEDWNHGKFAINHGYYEMK